MPSHIIHNDQWERRKIGHTLAYPGGQNNSTTASPGVV